MTLIKTSTGRRILDMHAAGRCPREIANVLKCRREKIYSTIANRGMACNPDPLRVHNERIRRRSESRGDALVESGEPDRRATCYFVFGQGGSDEFAMDKSGSTRCEVAMFRQQMPSNWADS